MKLKKLYLICLVFCSAFVFNACSKNSDAEHNVEIPDTQANKDTEAQKVELKEGDQLKEILKSIELKNTFGFKQNLAKVMGKEKTLIAVVKTGCVFCESMLAVKSSTKTNTKAKFIVVVSSFHSEFADFQDKHNQYRSAGGEWYYDFNNDFATKLGIEGFPRFFLINKKGELEKDQAGLITPEDESVLEGKEFAEVLQKLAEETVKWFTTI